MRVLFASGIDGFCHRYSVLHWAEQLATQGLGSTVRAHSDPRLAADLATHDLLVLYRVPSSAWIDHLLGRSRAAGRAAVFAVDDLIVTPELRDAPPTRAMRDEERHLWDDGVRRYRKTMLACDAVLATTGPLVEVGHAAGKPTYLHRQGLGASELALGAAAWAARRREPRPLREPVRLGYFSGTPTHDDDFATITPLLADLLERTSALELVIGGPLVLDAALARFSRRITRLPLVPWPELPALVAGTDVCLAPLEWRHPFVAAKGAIKYLEAAAVGVPAVASPTEAFRHAIRPGENGLLAGDAAEWQAALATLVTDQALRVALGAGAYADVRTRFDPATQGRALAATLEEIARTHAPRGETAEDGGALDEVALARAFPGEVARRAREPQAFPGWTIPPGARTTPPLGDGAPLTQSFRATADGLTRIDVHTVTYGLGLDHEVRARVRRDDGTTIATTTFAAALAPDRDWLAIELPPEAQSADRVYTLELEAHGSGPRNALSFGCSELPAAGAGAFTLGGIAGPSALALRTFSLACEPRQQWTADAGSERGTAAGSELGAAGTDSAPRPAGRDSDPRATEGDPRQAAAAMDPRPAAHTS